MDCFPVTQSITCREPAPEDRAIAFSQALLRAGGQPLWPAPKKSQRIKKKAQAAIAKFQNTRLINKSELPVRR